MRSLLANLLLSLVWGALTANFSPSNLLVGFVVGFVVLVTAQRAAGGSAYGTRVIRVGSFILFYLRELVLANVRVAVDVVTPRQRARPGVVAIPLDARTDVEITLLANLITMTPGSLTLDVSEDRKVLYVHAMFIDDPDEFRRDLKANLERRVLEMMR